MKIDKKYLPSYLHFIKTLYLYWEAFLILLYWWVVILERVCLVFSDENLVSPLSPSLALLVYLICQTPPDLAGGRSCLFLQSFLTTRGECLGQTSSGLNETKLAGLCYPGTFSSPDTTLQFWRPPYISYNTTVFIAILEIKSNLFWGWFCFLPIEINATWRVLDNIEK